MDADDTQVTNETVDPSDLAKVLGDLASRVQDMKENALIGEALQGETLDVAVVECRPCLRQSLKVGTWVAIRPAGDTRTYLGVYLGDLTLDVQAVYHKVRKTLTLQPFTNPTFFVPGKDQLFWGYGSWWRPLNSAEDLKDITDAAIDDVWYVRALKELSSKDSEVTP